MMSANDDQYQSFRIAVPTAYQDVFSHFYFAQNNSGRMVRKILLPSYQTILIFSFGTAPSLRSSTGTRIDVHELLLLGPIKQAFEYELPDGAELLIINFKDDAYFRFFGPKTNTVTLTVHPDELFEEDCFIYLWHELKKSANVEERTRVLLKFCDPFLQCRDKLAQQLADFNQNNLNPVKALAAQNNQTERTIQVNHKKHFGFSSKEHIRYKRFLKAVEMLQKLASSALKVNWFEIVEACGYYDQSQLIHDFKHYIHVSPSKYVKFQHDICNPIS